MSVEIPEWINERTVEEAYRKACRAQESRRESVAAAGMRAAKARDPKLLKALEGGAEVLHRMAVKQWSPSGTLAFHGGVRSAPTEANFWREAYTTVDQGEPMVQFSWIYAAAALLAGLYSWS